MIYDSSANQIYQRIPRRLFAYSYQQHSNRIYTVNNAFIGVSWVLKLASRGFESKLEKIMFGGTLA